MIEDVVSEFDKKRIQELLPKIDFTFSPITTSEKFPANFHILVSRPDNDSLFKETDIISPYYYFFLGIVERFCKRNNLKYKKVIRACLNHTYHIPGYVHGDPHYDFSYDHMVVIMYLTSSNVSSTLVFDKVQKFNNKNDVYPAPQTFPIKKEFLPELGKIIAFNGRYYHSNIIPPIGENRIACVFNLLIDKPWYRYFGFS